MQPVSRRTLAAGMAWSVPAVAASTVVPAFAASKEVAYRFFGTFHASYNYDGTNSCPTPGGSLSTLRLDNQTPQQGYPAGFAVIPETTQAGEQTPQANVTSLSLKMHYAFPVGMVHFDASNRFWYSLGSSTANYWTHPTHERISINGRRYDVFSFEWKGASQGRTNRPGDARTPWPNSDTLECTFTVNKNHCVGDSETYLFRAEISVETDNGWEDKRRTDWQRTRMVDGD